MSKQAITQKYEEIFNVFEKEFDASRRSCRSVNPYNTNNYLDLRWRQLHQDIHNDLHIEEIKKVHDAWINRCNTCTPSEVLQRSNYALFEMPFPSEKNLLYFLCASIKLLQHTGFYYLLCGAHEESIFCSEEHPCATCKGTTKACASIPFQGTTKTSCVDDWKL